MSGDPLTAVEHEQRGLVKGHVRVHGLDHADVVDAASQMREDLTDRDPTLPSPLELEGRAHQMSGSAFGFQIAGRIGLAVILLQHRLVVERVDMGGSAVQEEKDDLFGLAREVGRPGSQHRQRTLGLGQQAGGGYHAEAGAYATEQLSPIYQGSWRLHQASLYTRTHSS